MAGLAMDIGKNFSLPQVYQFFIFPHPDVMVNKFVIFRHGWTGLNMIYDISRRRYTGSFIRITPTHNAASRDEYKAEFIVGTTLVHEHIVLIQFKVSIHYSLSHAQIVIIRRLSTGTSASTFSNLIVKTWARAGIYISFL